MNTICRELVVIKVIQMPIFDLEVQGPTLRAMAEKERSSRSRVKILALSVPFPILASVSARFRVPSYSSSNQFS